uniref:TRAM domain-containing protein n=2 Tax=Ditylum brightwellii TaxID=49249 RepID=A0A7S1VZL9_9STRA
MTAMLYILSLRNISAWSISKANKLTARRTITSCSPSILSPTTNALRHQQCSQGGSQQAYSTNVRKMNQSIMRRFSSPSTNLVDGDQVEEEEKKVIKIPRKFNPVPFEYHQELTLRVVSLTNLGIGICRTQIDTIIDDKEQKDNSENNDSGDDSNSSSSGWVIMVPNVIPDELVRVRIYRNHKTYSDADLLEIIEASPNRIHEPKCPLSTICGGCQYQHMNVQTQREWKREQVEQLLQRVGGLDLNSFPRVKDTVGTDEVFHYRSKITPHYDAPSKNGGLIGPIGFKEKMSRRLVDIPSCAIATERINEKLTQVRDEVRADAKEGRLRRPKKGATLLLRDANEGVITDNNEYVTTKVDGLTFRFLAGNFFQNNPFMLPVMVDHVVTAATKPSSNGTIMTHLIDCYCGSGLFALGSASSFDVCVGIEVNDRAVEEARKNAELNDIKNCMFVSASAEAIFESTDPVRSATVNSGDDDGEGSGGVLVRDFPRESTVVVVDPPRKGCSEEFLEQLYEFAPQRVVYMSCDPATQARDAKGLVGNGYEIVSSQPFDLFPQTRHIESLVVFEKKRGDGETDNTGKD